MNRDELSLGRIPYYISGRVGGPLYKPDTDRAEDRGGCNLHL